jgi:lysophospholipase L1-like esterase
MPVNQANNTTLLIFASLLSKKHMNKKYGLYFYYAILHTIILFLIVECEFLQKISKSTINSPSEWGYIQKVTHAFNLRVDQNTSTGKVIFIGDSHIQGLAVNEVSKEGVNFGIGRDTSKTILNRIHQYQSIQSAKVVVLAFGINDFQYRSSEEMITNYKAILEVIPKTTRVVINGVFNIDTDHSAIKVTNEDILIFNGKLEQLTKEFKNTTFLSVNSMLTRNKELLRGYHIGDGLHLNQRGYEVWIHQLKIKLSKELT